MGTFLFGLGILVVVAAIPLLITKFVVDATERDLARYQAETAGQFVRESWYWAAAKSGLYFAVVGSLLGVLPFTVMAAYAPLGPLSVIDVFAGTMVFYLFALVFGGGMAFVAGVGFGLAIWGFGAVAWWGRALLGGLLGFFAGILVFGTGTPGWWVALLWYAPPGALCGVCIVGYF